MASACDVVCATGKKDLCACLQLSASQQALSCTVQSLLTTGIKFSDAQLVGRTKLLCSTRRRPTKAFARPAFACPTKRVRPAEMSSSALVIMHTTAGRQAGEFVLCGAQLCSWPAGRPLGLERRTTIIQSWARWLKNPFTSPDPDPSGGAETFVRGQWPSEWLRIAALRVHKDLADLTRSTLEPQPCDESIVLPSASLLRGRPATQSCCSSTRRQEAHAA